MHWAIPPILLPNIVYASGLHRWCLLEHGRTVVVVSGAGKTAILTMDVWEHAYYLDFQNVRPGYINTYIDKLISWDKIAERYTAATA